MCPEFDALMSDTAETCRAASVGYTVRATSFTGTSTDEGCTGACWSWVIVKSLEVWFLDEGWSWRRHEYGQMQQITVGQLGLRERERERGGIASKFEVINICWENDIWDVGEDLFRSVCHWQLTLLADSVEVPMQATLSEPPASLEPPPMRAAQVLVEVES